MLQKAVPIHLIMVLSVLLSQLLAFAPGRNSIFQHSKQVRKRVNKITICLVLCHSFH